MVDIRNTVLLQMKIPSLKEKVFIIIKSKLIFGN